jgi:Protein of unknown function (DUF3618)
VTTQRNEDERLPAEGAADLANDDADASSLTDEERAEAIEIRADIEETREEMGGTLQELGDRLEPGNLVQQAKDNVRDATIGRVEETAKGVSDMVIETIKNNPIPAAMAGAGLALLWMNRSDTSHGYGYAQPTYGRQDGPGVGQKVGDVAGSVGDTVSGAVGSVKGTAEDAVGTIAQGASQTAEQVGWRLDEFMQASPLAVGAIAVGAGVLAGTILPETQQERQILGDASRQVADTVRQTVDDVATKAEETMDETEEKVPVQ